MTDLDYYLTYDHAARGRTTLLSVFIGAGAGMISESLGMSFKTAGIFCILMVGAVEVTRAWRYVQPAERRGVAAGFPSPTLKSATRRSLIFVPVSLLLLLDRIADKVLAYRPKPKTKAAKRRKRRNQYAKRRRSESSI